MESISIKVRMFKVKMDSFNIFKINGSKDTLGGGSDKLKVKT